MKRQDVSGQNTLHTDATVSGGSDVNLLTINGVTPSVNNGTADTGTLRVTVASDSTGQITANLQSNTLVAGTTSVTPKFALIAAASAGDNTLVAAVGGKKIRVIAYNLIASGIVNAKFQSGAGGTDLTGLKYCVANMGICAPFSPVGWFETAANTLLNLNLSAGVAVGGELVYVEV